MLPGREVQGGPGGPPGCAPNPGDQGPRPGNIFPWGWTQPPGRAGPGGEKGEQVQGVRGESRSRGEKGEQVQG